MHCFRANTWYRSENPRAVCLFVSPVLIPPSTNRLVDHFHPTRYICRICPSEFFIACCQENIIRQRNFLCLWSKIIWKAADQRQNHSKSICAPSVWNKQLKSHLLSENVEPFQQRKNIIGTSSILAWGKIREGIPPPFTAAHPHRSFREAYPLIDASTADAKTVKVERIALQNILSLEQTAYCLQIELSG